MDLSVVVPTRDRATTLGLTLATLRAQVPPVGGAEVVVVDNGSQDETPEVIAAALEGPGLPIRAAREPKPGPAAARNHGVGLARGRHVLFLGDDTRPASPHLLTGHVAALSAGGPPRAVLGRIEWDDREPVTPFMRWLSSSGVQFAFAELAPGAVDLRRFFYTSNVSVPRDRLDAVGGFDERFTDAAVEDIELGARLADSGVELHYDPRLLVLHDHPTSYGASLRRTARVGASARRYAELFPDRPHPGIALVPAQRASLYAAAATVTAWRRAGDGLPTAVRELRWRIAHLHAFAEGQRR